MPVKTDGPFLEAELQFEMHKVCLEDEVDQPMPDSMSLEISPRFLSMTKIGGLEIEFRLLFPKLLYSVVPDMMFLYIDWEQEEEQQQPMYQGLDWASKIHWQYWVLESIVLCSRSSSLK